MRGRPALKPDVAAHVALIARVGVGAARIRRGENTEPAVVAELALIAPGRPDLIDEAKATAERGRRAPAIDWPPTDAQLMLLDRARRVTVGDVAMVGPGGVRVSVVRISSSAGMQPRPMLEVRRNGTVVGWYPTTEELARHVHLTTLVEELPSASDCG